MDNHRPQKAATHRKTKTDKAASREPTVRGIGPDHKHVTYLDPTSDAEMQSTREAEAAGRTWTVPGWEGAMPLLAITSRDGLRSYLAAELQACRQIGELGPAEATQIADRKARMAWRNVRRVLDHLEIRALPQWLRSEPAAGTAVEQELSDLIRWLTPNASEGIGTKAAGTGGVQPDIAGPTSTNQAQVPAGANSVSQQAQEVGHFLSSMTSLVGGQAKFSDPEAMALLSSDRFEQMTQHFASVGGVEVEEVRLSLAQKFGQLNWLKLVFGALIAIGDGLQVSAADAQCDPDAITFLLNRGLILIRNANSGEAAGRHYVWAPELRLAIDNGPQSMEAMSEAMHQGAFRATDRRLMALAMRADPAISSEATSQMADGPRPPSNIAWKGRSFPLQAIPYRLISCLWKAADHTMEKEDVFKEIWGAGEERSEAALKSAMSRTNNALLEHKIPISAGQKAGYVSLEVHHEDRDR